MGIKEKYYKYAKKYFYSLTEDYHILFTSFLIYEHYGIVNLFQSWSVT